MDRYSMFLLEWLIQFGEGYGFVENQEDFAMVLTLLQRGLMYQPLSGQYKLTRQALERIGSIEHG